MSDLVKKPDNVKVIQIAAAATPLVVTPNGFDTPRFYINGLGDDGNVYYWNIGEGIWYLNHIIKEEQPKPKFKQDAKGKLIEVEGGSKNESVKK